MEILLQFLMVLGAVFLIILILLQRGRGGGLAGALGGMGGQSAFGAKAGDVFTRITVGVAAAWFVVCLLAVLYMQQPSGVSGSFGSGAGIEVIQGKNTQGGVSKPDPVKPAPGGAAPATTPPASTTPPATTPPAGNTTTTPK